MAWPSTVCNETTKHMYENKLFPSLSYKQTHTRTHEELFDKLQRSENIRQSEVKPSLPLDTLSDNYILTVTSFSPCPSLYLSEIPSEFHWSAAWKSYLQSHTGNLSHGSKRWTVDGMFFLLFDKSKNCTHTRLTAGTSTKHLYCMQAST